MVRALIYTACEQNSYVLEVSLTRWNSRTIAAVLLGKEDISKSQ
ncbi:hypothetical protein ABFA07_007590 [Porites harrisoni]